MRMRLGTAITFFLLCLFAATSSLADSSTSSSTNSSSTETNTSNKSPGEPANSNANSTTKTTVTNSTTTTTVNDGDATIVGMIYKKYAKDSALDGTSLTVTCTNGVVAISGNVTMSSQAEEAVIDAKSIMGVKEVKSSINITTNQTESHRPKTPNY